jgi:hypothetical protein
MEADLDTVALEPPEQAFSDLRRCLVREVLSPPPVLTGFGGVPARKT